MSEISTSDWLKILGMMGSCMTIVVTLAWFIIGQRFQNTSIQLEKHCAEEMLRERDRLTTFIEQKSANNLTLIFSQGEKISHLESSHTTEIARLQDRAMDTKEKLMEVDAELKQIKESTHAMNIKLDILVDRGKSKVPLD
jgi:hypothetical protein